MPTRSTRLQRGGTVAATGLRGGASGRTGDALAIERRGYLATADGVGHDSCVPVTKVVGSTSIVLLLLAPFTSGCGGKAGAARARAAGDFHCDQKELEVETLGGSSFRVNNCGETATYACVHEGAYMNNAAWMAND